MMPVADALFGSHDEWVGESRMMKIDDNTKVLAKASMDQAKRKYVLKTRCTL
jgi:hypothetical protein